MHTIKAPLRKTLSAFAELRKQKWRNENKIEMCTYTMFSYATQYFYTFQLLQLFCYKKNYIYVKIFQISTGCLRDHVCESVSESSTFYQEDSVFEPNSKFFLSKRSMSKLISSNPYPYEILPNDLKSQNYIFCQLFLAFIGADIWSWPPFIGKWKYFITNLHSLKSSCVTYLFGDISLYNSLYTSF